MYIIIVQLNEFRVIRSFVGVFCDYLRPLTSPTSCDMSTGLLRLLSPLPPDLPYAALSAKSVYDLISIQLGPRKLSIRTSGV